MTPWIVACQASLSFTVSQDLLKFMSVASVILSNHLILCRLCLFLPSIFPWIRVFSNESALPSRWPKYCSYKVKSLSRVRLFATPWTIAYQAPLSMGFSRQEYWSGLPFPSPRDLPNPGIKPGSPALQTDALPSEPPGSPIYLSLKKKQKETPES